jgi:alkylation response protein AidB-like acyl-CoA dehydrogenase
VACKTAPELGSKGISILMVDADAPGFRRGRKLKKMGMPASETGELFFDNVRVPATNLLGPENGGFKVMVTSIDDDRIMWPLIGHASAQRCFDDTVDFVKQRKAFGQTVFDFQNTQFKLAELKTELMMGRLFLEECLRQREENGRLDRTMAAMAKLWVPDMETRVIDECVQLHGGAGYMDEYPVSRFYTAARVHRILGGTSEIMRLIIGRSI